MGSNLPGWMSFELDSLFAADTALDPALEVLGLDAVAKSQLQVTSLGPKGTLEPVFRFFSQAASQDPRKKLPAFKQWVAITLIVCCGLSSSELGPLGCHSLSRGLWYPRDLDLSAGASIAQEFRPLSVRMALIRQGR